MLRTYYKADQAKELSSKEAQAATNGGEDYRFKTANNLIGGAERKGLRGSQEDRIDVQELPDFASLTKEQQESVLQDTIDAVHNDAYKHSHRFVADGTVLLTNIVIPKETGTEVLTLSLGDGLTWLVRADENQKIDRSQVKLINDYHHPTAARERARIQHLMKSNPDIFIEEERDRLNGQIGVSGAIGDYYILGMTQEAYLYRDVLKSNQTNYMISACDGLTMGRGEITEKLNDQLERNLPLEDIANNWAKTSEVSRDNVSVVITDLNKISADAKPFAVSVYDGHGGQRASTFCQQVFLSMLNANVKLTLEGTKTLENPLEAYLEAVDNLLSKEEQPLEQFLYHFLDARKIKKELDLQPQQQPVVTPLFFKAEPNIAHVENLTKYVNESVGHFLRNNEDTQRARKEAVRICEELRKIHKLDRTPVPPRKFSRNSG